MKKLNSTTYKYATKVSTYSQYKVIETNDGFFLNTVYHNNKETFEPTTRQSYNGTTTDSSPQNNLILDRHTSYNASVFPKSSFQDSVIPDLYEPHVYYIMSYNFLGKYEEKDGTITELNKVYYSGSAANQIYYYLGQTQDYLFVACCYDQTKYLYKILKSTLAGTTMLTFYCGYRMNYHGRPTVIKETTNYIYFYLLRTANSSNSTAPPILSVYKINKEEATCELVKDIETVSSNGSMFQNVTDAVVEISDTVAGLFIRYPIGACASDTMIKFVKLDVADETAPDVTMSAFTISNFTAPTNATTSTSVNHYMFMNTINGKEYLYCIRNLFVNGTETGNDASKQYFHVYTFQVTRNTSTNVPTTLTQVGFVQGADFFDSDVKSFIVTQDNKIIVFWTKKGLYITKVDEATGTFVLMQTLDSSTIRTFGIDKLNRIWIYYNDDTVGFVGLTDFSSYIIEFENDSYSYTGEDINTYITLRCLDVLENRMDASFNLTIVGNALFDNTNTKVITVATSSTDTEDLQVPITINGAGRIIVYPTLVTD